jgi:Cu+-exporting ATPase
VKVINKIFFLLLFVLFFVSCEKKESSGKTDPKPSEKVVAENLHYVKVEIKGMTCEIGCARLIQSKLYKADGVSFAKVSFEDSTGIVSYDQNRINTEEIKKVIENTAGGEIYSVVTIEEIDGVDDLEITQ